VTERIRFVIGLPTYRWSTHFMDAVGSIVGQTLPGLAIVIRQDGDDPEAHEYLSSLAKAYPHIDYAQNETRLGMVDNWRLVFEEARRLYPDAEYFAWGSDHDVWHPDFALRMAEALDADPDAVLAYPRSVPITEDSDPTAMPWTFETRGIREPGERLDASWKKMSAGNMVYGAFRARALEKAGVFPRTLLPDQVILLRLAAAGTFIQVPQLLWWRRKMPGGFSVKRQRKSLFGPRAPAYAILPPTPLRAAAVTSHLIKHRSEFSLPATKILTFFLRMTASGFYGSTKKFVRRPIDTTRGAVRKMLASEKLREFAKFLIAKLTNGRTSAT
jgi:hypothetical protein